jgi:uncharacterized protein with von Willebrand factor type A (vWA) domain
VSHEAPLGGDLASLVGLFGRELHAAGIGVSAAESGRLAEVIELRRPLTVTELYWCARISLVRSPDQIGAFDAVFSMVFRQFVDVAEYRGQQPRPTGRGEYPEPRDQTPGMTGATSATAALSQKASETEYGRAGVQLRSVASDEERLRSADFSQLTPEELDVLAPLLRELLVRMPRRRTRRRHVSAHGDRLDVRATLRRSVGSGGDPVRAIRRSRATAPRRLVALLDISGSMEPYARAYLHLLWGAASLAHAEVFAFGTRLTRLTPALRFGQPDVALARAARMMPDWSGGTRIGDSMKLFLDRYGRRGMAHGAVMLIVSDGWERGDPAILAKHLDALARRAHRMVWVNPRVAAPEFAPLTGGMSVAMPFIDALVSGHSANAMRDVVQALSESQG